MLIPLLCAHQVTPDGVRFGHRIWADLFVEAAPAPAPTALPPAPTTAPGSGAGAAAAPGADPPAPTPAPAATGSPAPEALPAPTPLERVPSATGRPGVAGAAPVGAPVPLGPEVLEGAQRWATQLLVLGEMGLHDLAANVAALDAFDGDVSRAVNRLFGLA